MTLLAVFLTVHLELHVHWLWFVALGLLEGLHLTGSRSDKED